MADRSGIYCPYCEKNEVKNELLRGAPEMHLFRCNLGHCFDYSALMAQSPNMVKLEVVEKPGPNDLKVSVFIEPAVWQRFCAKYPNQRNSTLNSILNLCVDDDLVLVSGDQARELKKLGVRTGADMLACAQNNNTLTVENEALVKENNRFLDAMTSRMATAE